MQVFTSLSFPKISWTNGRSKHCSVEYLGESLILSSANFRRATSWNLPTLRKLQMKRRPRKLFSYELLHDASCVYDVHNEFIASNEKSLVVTWCARICRTSLQIRRKTCSKDTMKKWKTMFPSESIHPCLS